MPNPFIGTYPEITQEAKKLISDITCKAGELYALLEIINTICLQANNYYNGDIKTAQMKLQETIMWAKKAIIEPG